MLKIGLTGGIASGKSTICQLFSHHDIPIIDADIIARQLVEPNLDAWQEIKATFGDGVIMPDDSLNRPMLRDLIFSDPAAKKKLETILHPRIRRQIKIQADRQQTQYCIIALPLLIEANFQQAIDRILVVDLDPAQQLQRLCQREKLDKIEAQRIISSQCSRMERLRLADDIIVNDQSKEELMKIVHTLDQKYRKLAQC